MTQPFSFSDLFKRAVTSVGTLTILATVVIYGITNILFGFGWALKISIPFFGLIGFIEIFIRQSKSKVNARLKIPDVATSAIRQVLKANPFTNIQPIKELDYKGFYFRYLGIADQPAALGISIPMCPRCKNHLIERPKWKIYKFVFVSTCLCGLQVTSKQTQAELMLELLEVRPSQF